MKVPFYDIKAQYEELQGPLDQAVHAVLSSGIYTISGGKECGAFEAEMAAYHQVKHAISLNSGTDALRILMDAAGIGSGDEVITTAFTFVASVETILQTGAQAVLVDIDPRTFMIDMDALESAITPKTKAILPIHLFGQLCDVSKLTALAQKHNLIVLEDAAQAVGSTFNGNPAGNFGLGAGLSFYVTKNLGAAGDAGMIITNDDSIAEACRSIRVHGMGRERYYYDHLGYTSRMDEIQAAVLRVKLARLDDWNKRRTRWAEIYLDVLEDSGLALPSVSPGNNHTWHQFTIRTPCRDELQLKLKESGIDSMIYYPVPIHKHAPYKRCAIGPGGLAKTEAVANEVLSLPVQPHLTEGQVRFAAETTLKLTPTLVSP